MSGQQIPFPPSVGFLVEATPPRIECKACGLRLAPGAGICPSCGLERPRYAGQEYPTGRWERFLWLYDQPIKNREAYDVLHALLKFDLEGGEIFPTVATIAETARLSQRATHNALDWLEGCGWIVRHQRRRGGRQTSTRYVIRQAETVARERQTAPRAVSQTARGAVKGTKG